MQLELLQLQTEDVDCQKLETQARQKPRPRPAVMVTSAGQVTQLRNLLVEKAREPIETRVVLPSQQPLPLGNVAGGWTPFWAIHEKGFATKLIHL